MCVCQRLCRVTGAYARGRRAVRTKAKLLALRYGGIRILIVRRTYPELINNHIGILRTELRGIAKYNDKDKVLKFHNGSSIHFAYCAKDADLDRLQGVEYDVIFLDEATQLSEFQMKKGIHPEYGPATVTCSCGNVFQTNSTVKSMTVNSCSACHPYYTGKKTFVDTEGRIDSFKRRFANYKKAGK